MHKSFAEGDLLKRTRKFRCIDYYFESGDLDAFIKIVESEALTLRHDDFYAVFILMKPNTLQIINAIWNLGMKRKFRLFHARCWCQCTCFVSRKR
jgi:diphosphomevalonate decarboxylase